LPARAQAGAQVPALTPAEAQAQDMGLTLASFCNPARHRTMGTSESVVERPSGSLEGTASFLRSAEGTFVVLERYDEELAGHCLVLGWFGGELEPGRYPIKRLAMSSLEAEVDGADLSFYAFAAVRTPDENSMFVTESGTLEIATMGGRALAGTFEMSGFVLEGGNRTDGVALHGSFSALDPG
jgi:hypothetical protein